MVTETQEENNQGVAKVFLVFWLLAVLSFVFPAHLPIYPVAETRPVIKIDSVHNLG